MVGETEEEFSSNPESVQDAKWFPARWDGHKGWAREIMEKGYEFSVQLPEEAGKYPESVVLSATKDRYGESFRASFRSGETRWRLVEINRRSGMDNYLSMFSAHVGERGIEDRVSLDKIQSKHPVDL